MSRVPTEDRTRQRLTDLRNGLLKLHKVLLDSERDAYDHNISRITSSGQLLDLVLNDPFFAWLRELSQFIVLIDETLDWHAEDQGDDNNHAQYNESGFHAVPSIPITLFERIDQCDDLIDLVQILLK